MIDPRRVRGTPGRRAPSLPLAYYRTSRWPYQWPMSVLCGECVRRSQDARIEPGGRLLSPWGHIPCRREERLAAWVCSFLERGE